MTHPWQVVYVEGRLSASLDLGTWVTRPRGAKLAYPSGCRLMILAALAGLQGEVVPVLAQVTGDSGLLLGDRTSRQSDSEGSVLTLTTAHWRTLCLAIIHTLSQGTETERGWHLPYSTVTLTLESWLRGGRPHPTYPMAVSGDREALLLVYQGILPLRETPLSPELLLVDDHPYPVSLILQGLQVWAARVGARYAEQLPRLTAVQDGDRIRLTFPGHQHWVNHWDETPLLQLPVGSATDLGGIRVLRIDHHRYWCSGRWNSHHWDAIYHREM